MASRIRVRGPEYSATLIHVGEGTGDNIPLKYDECKIGRQRGRNTFYLLDPSLSKEHCVVRRINDEFQLVDISSSGTRVNGNKLVREQEYCLEEGDIVQFGPTPRLVYRFSIHIKKDVLEEIEKLREEKAALERELMNAREQMNFLRENAEHAARDNLFLHETLERQKAEVLRETLERQNAEVLRENLERQNAGLLRETRERQNAEAQRNSVAREEEEKRRGTVIFEMKRAFKCEYCGEASEDFEAFVPCGHIYCNKCIATKLSKDGRRLPCRRDGKNNQLTSIKVPMISQFMKRMNAPGPLTEVDEDTESIAVMIEFGDRRYAPLTPVQKKVVFYFSCFGCGMLLVGAVALSCGVLRCSTCAGKKEEYTPECIATNSCDMFSSCHMLSDYATVFPSVDRFLSHMHNLIPFDRSIQMETLQRERRRLEYRRKD